MSEIDIMRSIQVHLSTLGHRVWRNNVGRIRDPKGYWIVFGLCVGSPDLVGHTKDGIFLGIEVKTATGRVSPEQRNFIEAARKHGCRVGIARTNIDAERIANGEFCD